MNASDVMAAVKASGKPFYVYILNRPCGTPFYVGVGCRYRVVQHESEARSGRGNSHKLAIIRKIWEGGGGVIYALAGHFDDWHEAAAFEVSLIANIGRSDVGAGPLANLTDGGEGSPGTVVSVEAREKRAAALRGRKRDPEIGRKIAAAWLVHQYRHGPDARAKMSAAQVNRVAGPCPPERIERIAESNRGQKRTEEARAKMRVAQQALRARQREAGGLKIPHHKGKTPEGRAKHRRPVEIGGVTYAGTDIAAETLQVGRTTIKRWLKVGTHGARRL